MATCDEFYTISTPPDKHLFPGHSEMYLEHGQVKAYEYLWLFTSFDPHGKKT